MGEQYSHCFNYSRPTRVWRTRRISLENSFHVAISGTGPMDWCASYRPFPLFYFYSWSSTLSAPTPSSSSGSLSWCSWLRPYVVCGAFLAFISGVQLQGGVAQPPDGSSTGLSQLLFISSSLLLSYSHLDHLSRLCFDQRSIGICQPYPSGQAKKKLLHPNRRGEREPLQNPKLLVLHII